VYVTGCVVGTRGGGAEYSKGIKTPNFSKEKMGEKGVWLGWGGGLVVGLWKKRK